MSQVKRLDATEDSLKDTQRLQEDNRALQEQVEVSVVFSDLYV